MQKTHHPAASCFARGAIGAVVNGAMVVASEMATPMDSRLQLCVLLNLLLALVNGAATLVLLLIAPLGLAVVVTCTAIVTLLTFAGGLAGDLILWRWLLPGAAAQGPGSGESMTRIPTGRRRLRLVSSARLLTQRRDR